VDDSIVEDDVWKNNLSGLSSSGGDENSGSVGGDGELNSVVGGDVDASVWESSREDCDWLVDCVVEEEIRELELVECSQVRVVEGHCNVGWDEDGDWVGCGELGLSWSRDV